MSNAAFKSFLVQSIVDRAADSVRAFIRKEGENGIESIVTNRTTGKSVVSDESLLSTAGLRSATDAASSGYKSIFSKQGLENLAQSFKSVSKDNADFAEVAKFLDNPNLYSHFKDFLVTEKYKDSLSKKSASKRYSYNTIKTDAGDIRIGSLKQGVDTENYPEGNDFIIFKNLSHGKLKTLFLEFLSKKYSSYVKEISLLEKFLDGGHLTGIFNARVKNIFDVQVGVSTSDRYYDYSVSAGSDQLSNEFQKILNLLTDADFISSNIYYDIELFSSLSKDVYSKNGLSVAAELQLSITNSEAGRALSAIGRHLNSLILAVEPKKSRIDSVGAKKAVDGILKNLSSVVKIIEKRAAELQKTALSPKIAIELTKLLSRKDLVVDLLNQSGSDSINTAISKIVRNTLLNKPIPARQVTKVTSKKTIAVGSKNKKKSPAPTLKKPVSRKLKVNYSPSNHAPQTYSLAGLQSILTATLNRRIKENMGTGNRKDILNLRSGRFAESVKVERLSESRAGMITAFYSYMRNPYATFSEGGRQQYPRSRDPKLLISKTIREIAAEQAYARMRAVLV